MTDWNAFSALFKTTLLLYAAAALVYLILIALRRKGTLAELLVGLAFLANSADIVRAWMATGHPPFQTLFQSLVFFSWSVTFFFFITRLLTRVRLIGLFTTVFAAAALAFALGKPDFREVLMPPALQSVWFIPHVIFYFFGYGALFISFVTALLHLRFPQPKTVTLNHWLGYSEVNFERFTYNAIRFGFFLITLGLFVGAVWAESAWSAYWSWDPKENWALITWLIYLAYLHLRRRPRWQGKPAAIFAIVGFAAVIVTYLGVNYLPSIAGALHAYQ